MSKDDQQDNKAAAEKAAAEKAAAEKAAAEKAAAEAAAAAAAEKAKASQPMPTIGDQVEVRSVCGDRLQNPFTLTWFDESWSKPVVFDSWLQLQLTGDKVKVRKYAAE